MKVRFVFINTVVISLLVLIGNVTFVHAQTVNDFRIITPHDDFPRFCGPPVATDTAVRNGDWTVGTTWASGRSPGAGAAVAIPAGVTVTYDGNSNTRIKCIDVAGTLRFRTDVDTELYVSDIDILPTGTMEIGTTTDRVEADKTARIVVMNTPLETGTIASPGRDVQMVGTGIRAFGKWEMAGADIPKTFIRMEGEAFAGDTTIQLDTPAIGWRVGNKGMVPHSRYFRDDERNTYTMEDEEFTITAISADQKTLTISNPLIYDHPGGRNRFGVLELSPFVGLLSRNVIIESEDPAGVRAITLSAMRADMNIEGAWFKDTGRTTTDPLNNTLFDANGNPTQFGTNQIARYGLHLHHLMGPVRTVAQQNDPNVYQVVVRNNSIDNSNSPDGNKIKWGITIHGTHYGLIEGNVVYDHHGAGIVTEDGTESHNLIKGNFVARILGKGARADDGINRLQPGGQASGLWYGSINNDTVDNVVASVQSTEVDSFGAVLFNDVCGSSCRRPRFKGANMALDAETITEDPNAVAMGLFERNEFYAMAAGVTAWYIGNWRSFISDPNIARSTFKDNTVWHFYRFGIWAYPWNNVTIDGLVTRNPPTFPGPGGIAVELTDYMTTGGILQNLDAQGVNVGLEGPVDFNDGSPDFLFRDSFVSAVKGVIAGELWNCCGKNLFPRRFTIRNVVFEAIPGLPLITVAHEFVEDHQLSYLQADLRQLNEVFLEDHQGVQGDNYEIFQEEQAPSHIMLAESANFTGCMNGQRVGVPNLTNLECFTAYNHLFPNFTMWTAGKDPGCGDPDCTAEKALALSIGVNPGLAKRIGGPPPPSLQVSSPTEGESVPAGTVTVDYVTSGDMPAAGVDHIHLTLNGGTVIDNVPLASGSHDLTSVAAGSHVLVASLVDSNHSLVPGANTEVTRSFTATSGPPPANLQVSSPTEGGSVPAGTVPIDYVTSGDLSAADHIHLVLDGGSVIDNVPLASGSHDLTSVAAGSHVLVASLVDSNHSLVPGANTEVTRSFTATPTPNNPPTLTFVPADLSNLIATVGQTFTLLVTGTDPDGDINTTLDATNLPLGATFQ